MRITLRDQIPGPLNLESVILFTFVSLSCQVLLSNGYRKQPLGNTYDIHRNNHGNLGSHIPLLSPASSSSSSSSSHHHASPINRQKCDKALDSCFRNMRCEMALRDYRTSCSHLLHNKTSKCSEVCRLAVMTLHSLSEGYDYLNCDCGDNEFCRKVRRRTSVCHSRYHQPSIIGGSSSVNSGIGSHGLIDSKGRSKVKSLACSQAESRCKEDETCGEAWDFFHQHCEKVFNGIECTKACNNSLNILWRQKAASALNNCICDQGSTSSSLSSLSGPSYHSEVNCKRRKANIKRLCFGYSSPSALSGHTNKGQRLISLTFNSILHWIGFLLIRQTVISLT